MWSIFFLDAPQSKLFQIHIAFNYFPAYAYDDGQYHPDSRGQYIPDERGRYIPDGRGFYVHRPGPDGPPAVPYVHILGPNGGFGGFGPDGGFGPNGTVAIVCCTSLLTIFFLD